MMKCCAACSLNPVPQAAAAATAATAPGALSQADADELLEELDFLQKQLACQQAVSSWGVVLGGWEGNRSLGGQAGLSAQAQPWWHVLHAVRCQAAPAAAPRFTPGVHSFSASSLACGQAKASDSCPLLCLLMQAVDAAVARAEAAEAQAEELRELAVYAATRDGFQPLNVSSATGGAAAAPADSVAGVQRQLAAAAATAAEAEAEAAALSAENMALRKELAGARAAAAAAAAAVAGRAALEPSGEWRPGAAGHCDVRFCSCC